MWNPRSFLKQAYHQATDFGNDPIERWFRAQLGDAYNVMRKLGPPEYVNYQGVMRPAGAGTADLPFFRAANALHVLGLKDAYNMKEIDRLGYVFHGTGNVKDIMRAGYLDPEKAMDVPHFGKKVWTTTNPQRAIGHGHGNPGTRHVIAIPRTTRVYQNEIPVQASGATREHVYVHDKPIVLRSTPETRAKFPREAAAAKRETDKARLARRLARSKSRAAKYEHETSFGGH